jgi:hypothetical protein
MVDPAKKKDIEAQLDELDMYINDHPIETIIVDTLTICSVILLLLAGIILLVEFCVYLANGTPTKMRFGWTFLLGGLATLSLILPTQLFKLWYGKHRMVVALWVSGVLSVGLSIGICYGVYMYVL